MTDAAQAHGDEDRKAFASLADKYWDLANTLVGVAVAQTLVFLFALGTSATLDFFIKCTDWTWQVSVLLIIGAFCFYLVMLRRYGADEIAVRAAAGQTDAVQSVVRRAATHRRMLVIAVLLVTLVAMGLHYPERHAAWCEEERAKAGR